MIIEGMHVVCAVMLSFTVLELLKFMKQKFSMNEILTRQMTYGLLIG